MIFLLTCLFIATLLPYLTKLPVVYAMYKAGGYDNNHPREQQARLVGFGARAVAAHQNSFESLLIFAIAILVALLTQTTTPLVQNLAAVYLVSRVVYTLLYLGNLGTLRSLVWAVGLVCSLTILCSSIPSV